jgi:hypothetical protein
MTRGEKYRAVEGTHSYRCFLGGGGGFYISLVSCSFTANNTNVLLQTKTCCYRTNTEISGCTLKLCFRSVKYLLYPKIFSKYRGCLLSRHWAPQRYHVESLHPPVHSVTAAVLRTAMEETHCRNDSNVSWFETLTAVTGKNQICCDVAVCHWVDFLRCRGTAVTFSSGSSNRRRALSLCFEMWGSDGNMKIILFLYVTSYNFVAHIPKCTVSRVTRM